MQNGQARAHHDSFVSGGRARTRIWVWAADGDDETAASSELRFRFVSNVGLPRECHGHFSAGLPSFCFFSLILILQTDCIHCKRNEDTFRLSRDCSGAGHRRQCCALARPASSGMAIERAQLGQGIFSLENRTKTRELDCLIVVRRFHACLSPVPGPLALGPARY